MKSGIYETDYGNAAVVLSGINNLAYDLDMAEVIPMSMVTSKFIRDLDDYDEAIAFSILLMTLVRGYR